MTARPPRPVRGLLRRPVALPTLLLRINRTAIAVAVGIVFAAVVVGSYLIGLINLVETAHVQAQVLANNAAPAIRAQDREAAAALLGALRHWPQVLSAELFDANHRPVAHYGRGTTQVSGVPSARDTGLNPFFLHVRQDIGDADGRVGMLFLTVTIEPLYRQTAWIAVTALIAALVSLGVSQMLLRHLDRSVLGPLQALNELMAQVHGQSDFTLRARRTHIVEIDALARGFNQMLEKIHERDQQLARLAFSDVLTGLPNRPAFIDRLEREFQRASRGGHRLGLLFLDLDGFKQVNDTLGHEAGDRLLVEAAGRIREALRPADAAARADGPVYAPQSARLGGDEFTVLVPDLREAADVMVVARRIGDSMRRPFFIDGRELAITASIGAAVFPEDGKDVPTLLQRADTAMYDAKRSGRDNSRRYSATLAKPTTDAHMATPPVRPRG
jgi:diguanylate cyclase (GGDEF)-like protein